MSKDRTPLKPPSEAAQDEKRRGVPRTPLQRFLDAETSGKPTRKQAIEAMCWGCMGGDTGSSPGVREEIRGCTARKCPLKPFRPFR